ncbi:MAG TPA: four helix bundle protein [Pirellulales bacterium]|nr:four helix bundle protein [Pirellulales bacterium]
MLEKSRYRLEEFELYQAARDFRRKIYGLLSALSNTEKYCLDQQMRRAAVSITNNIAEGHGRWHYQENIQFCRMARGSLEEIIDDLTVCEDQHYRSSAMLIELKQQAYQLISRINGYISYLRKSQLNNRSE